ncbi:ATP-binding protein [Streptomyces sp. NPDC052496]|uniref:ATP-binding protein n=1 Tax=Streptomyces sp. NPDC052496 TaxID=3154951 RepID=UPI003435D96D
MQSRRDLMIREFVGQRLVRAAGEHTRHPVLLLLGPRGSGKSTLSDQLETWGRRAPLAALDLAALDDGVHHPVDVLARIAFQLNARRPDFPPLALPSFAVLLMALSAEADPESRDAALAQTREALRTGRAEDHSLAVLRELVTSVGVPMGLPGWSAAVVPLIQGWQRARVWWGVHRRLRRVPRGGPRPQAPADALVELNQHFRHGTAAQRERAESVLLQAFLADLQGAYTRHGGDRTRTLRCLVLLDNADSELGDAFLQALVEARATGPEHPDPLVVVASARRAPDVLRQLEQGPRQLGGYLSCWQPPEREDGPELFVPRVVARPGGGARLEVAQLRPLDRAEVQEQASPCVKRMPQAALAGIAHPVAWLGRTVHELTRGHPAATRAVLDALEDFAPGVPCGRRLRMVMAPEGPHSVADTLLELLLQDLPQELAEAALPRAAAAVTLGQAASTAGLWQDGVPPRLLRGLAHDDRHARRLTFDGQPHSALPDLVRRLLLGRLSLAPAPAADASASPWDRTHEILRDAAESGRVGAYHGLASGDVQGTVNYLYDRFLDVCEGPGSARAWCEELSWIQRAPRRWEAEALGRSAGAEFQHRLARAQSPPDRLMVTRLLVAGWITTHPATDPYAALWSDPLGDPAAELYPKIVDALQTLSGRLSDETDHDVLWQRAAAYERKPW